MWSQESAVVTVAQEARGDVFMRHVGIQCPVSVSEDLISSECDHFATTNWSDW